MPKARVPLPRPVLPEPCSQQPTGAHANNHANASALFRPQRLGMIDLRAAHTNSGSLNLILLVTCTEYLDLPVCV